MVTVATECRRAGGITLVECRLTNERERAVRVHLQSRLDGPTWPPREGVHVTNGWSDGEWTGRLPPARPVGVGFASPAPPCDEPVRVEELGEATEETGRFGRDPTPDDVARELTDPRPPRAGLFDDSTAGPPERGTAQPNPSVDAIDAFLDDVTARVDRYEALAAARTVPGATAAVERESGLDGVRRLHRSVETDREQLLELATRAETLAGRIETTAVPVETLERLA